MWANVIKTLHCSSKAIIALPGTQYETKPKPMCCIPFPLNGYCKIFVICRPMCFNVDDSGHDHDLGTFLYCKLNNCLDF